MAESPETPPPPRPPWGRGAGAPQGGSEGEPPEGGSPRDEIPRLPWALRLLLYYSFILVLLHFGGAVLLTLFVPIDELTELVDIDYSVLLAIQGLMAVPIMLATRGFLMRFEGLPLSAIGVRWPGEPGQAWRWLALAGALAAGGLTIWWLSAGLFLGLEVVGWLPDSVEGASWWPGVGGRLLSVVLLVLAFTSIATIEEWIYRGYIYSLLRQRLPWVHAAGVTTLLYVLLLAGGASIPAAGLFNILLLELILAGLREATGSVWTGVVFHASWNVLLGAVMSMPVSGQSMPRLWEVTVQGNVQLSGGEFGPEGSWLLTVPLLLILAFLGSRLTEGGGETEPDEG